MTTGLPQPAAFRPTSLLVMALIIAALYFGREFLLPLALAALISFLLAPLIRRLEHCHFGRVGSVLTATALAFSVIGVIGYLVVGQMIDLASQLPSYKSNLGAKIGSLKTERGSPMDRATQTFRELGTQLREETAPAATTPPPDAEASARPVATPPPTTAATPSPARAGKAATPLPVVVVETRGSAFSSLKEVVGPVLNPLGTAAVVAVFVIFMLLEREDLRDRVIHLIGRGRLGVTTNAIDDAARRVSRYLLAQLVVNVTYGIPIGIGLYFIGIPNAFLWAFLTAILRFVPYIGPWIGAAFPMILSLAVSPNWSMPLMTLGLFIVVELISNNVVEPWLYGSSTGLSSMAVIVSAVFWAWLWGTPGLLLATPLTVCIAVLGKHVPSLEFFDVLLGDNPPIAVQDRFYQRLLALDAEETLDLVETHVEAHQLSAAFDEMLIPTLGQAEADFRAGQLSEATRRDMYSAMRELLAEIAEPLPTGGDEPQVLCIPASNEADELAAIMLARLLADAGIKSRVLSAKMMTGELIEQAVTAAPRLICISAIPPGSVLPATHLCKRLRERLDAGLITVGLWGSAADFEPRRLDRLKRAHADHVFTTLKQASVEVLAQPALAAAAAAAAAPPAMETVTPPDAPR